MGYDLHLTRADDWTEAAISPIPEAAWEQVASVRLHRSTSVTVDGGPPIYQLDEQPDSPTLQWIGGAVTVWGAGEDRLAQLVSLAEALDAHVIGDDGERYPLQNSNRGKSRSRWWKRG